MPLFREFVFTLQEQRPGRDLLVEVADAPVGRARGRDQAEVLGGAVGVALGDVVLQVAEEAELGVGREAVHQGRQDLRAQVQRGEVLGARQRVDVEAVDETAGHEVESTVGGRLDAQLLAVVLVALGQAVDRERVVGRGGDPVARARVVLAPARHRFQRVVTREIPVHVERRDVGVVAPARLVEPLQPGAVHLLLVVLLQVDARIVRPHAEGITDQLVVHADVLVRHVLVLGEHVHRLGRGPAQAQAIALAVLSAAIGADGVVHVGAALAVDPRDAGRKRVGDRAGHVAFELVRIDVAVLAEHARAEFVRGPRGVHADRAGNGVAPVQRALRAAQHLDAIHVEHRVARQPAAPEIDLVDVDPDGALDGVQARAAEAAHRHRGHAPAVLRDQAGRLQREPLERGDALLLHRHGGLDRHRDGHLEDVLGTPLRGDHDFLEFETGVGMHGNARDGEGERSDQEGRTNGTDATTHEPSPR